VLARAIPKTLVDKVGLDALMQRLPEGVSLRLSRRIAADIRSTNVLSGARGSAPTTSTNARSLLRRSTSSTSSPSSRLPKLSSSVHCLISLSCMYDFTFCALQRCDIRRPSHIPRDALRVIAYFTLPTAVTKADMEKQVVAEAEPLFHTTNVARNLPVSDG
jgi:hypothetical protein